MPRHKTPLAVAKITGAYAAHPDRYKGSQDPVGLEGLGGPPEHLSEPERAAWRAFAQELPWLVSSDRALLASACSLRARVQAGDEPNAALIRELRMHVTSKGGSPSARSSIFTFPEPAEDVDPFAIFDSTN